MQKENLLQHRGRGEGSREERGRKGIDEQSKPCLREREREREPERDIVGFINEDTWIIP